MAAFLSSLAVQFFTAFIQRTQVISSGTRWQLKCWACQSIMFHHCIKTSRKKAVWHFYAMRRLIISDTIRSFEHLIFFIAEIQTVWVDLLETSVGCNVSQNVVQTKIEKKMKNINNAWTNSPAPDEVQTSKSSSWQAKGAKSITFPYVGKCNGLGTLGLPRCQVIYSW